MDEEVQEVKPPFVEVSGGDEAEVVPADVEHEDGAAAANFDKIGMREVPPHIGQAFLAALRATSYVGSIPITRSMWSLNTSH